MDHSPGFLKLVADIKHDVRDISVAELRAWQEAGRSFILIDVREESEWSAGHLPGARHLSKGIIERDIERSIPDPNSTLILYCGGGYRSALAAANIQKMGFRDVFSLSGGFRAWVEQNLPLIQPTTPPKT